MYRAIDIVYVCCDVTPYCVVWFYKRTAERNPVVWLLLTVSQVICFTSSHFYHRHKIFNNAPEIYAVALGLLSQQKHIHGRSSRQVTIQDFQKCFLDLLLDQRSRPHMNIVFMPDTLGGTCDDIILYAREPSPSHTFIDPRTNTQKHGFHSRVVLFRIHIVRPQRGTGAPLHHCKAPEKEVFLREWRAGYLGFTKDGCADLHTRDPVFPSPGSSEYGWGYTTTQKIFQASGKHGNQDSWAGLLTYTRACITPQLERALAVAKAGLFQQAPAGNLFITNTHVYKNVPYRDPHVDGDSLRWCPSRMPTTEPQTRAFACAAAQYLDLGGGRVGSKKATDYVKILDKWAEDVGGGSLTDEGLR